VETHFTQYPRASASFLIVKYNVFYATRGFTSLKSVINQSNPGEGVRLRAQGG
jgi:hypothetical protein